MQIHSLVPTVYSRQAQLCHNRSTETFTIQGESLLVTLNYIQCSVAFVLASSTSYCPTGQDLSQQQVYKQLQESTSIWSCTFAFEERDIVERRNTAFLSPQVQHVQVFWDSGLLFCPSSQLVCCQDEQKITLILIDGNKRYDQEFTNHGHQK